MLSYHVSMECFAVTGQIVAGFALTAQANSSGLLSHLDNMSCYPMFRILMEACRVSPFNLETKGGACLFLFLGPFLFNEKP